LQNREVAQEICMMVSWLTRKSEFILSEVC
jgi:hypothetical protein